nr:unnamed protein product [Spirometra erinaceieuropaei]
MRNKEEALETSRLLLETERTKTILGIQELSARSAALESQLQQCTSELKRVNQRNHEFGTLLTSLQKERSQLLELDRQKSKVIDSLNYQFLELNAEKQKLAETVMAAKTSTQGRVSELQARLATMDTELTKAVQEATSHRRRADVLAQELEELRACLVTQSQQQQQLQEQQQPTCSAEVSSTSAPITADEVAATAFGESLRLDDAAPAFVDTAVEELVYSKSGPNKAKDQQTLLQTTLVNTENTLARLQRSIEEEEAKWRHLLLESERRNAHLKRQLEAIKTNSTKAEDGLSDLDGDFDDDWSIAVDSSLAPEDRLNGNHSHQKTVNASL